MHSDLVELKIGMSHSPCDRVSNNYFENLYIDDAEHTHRISVMIIFFITLYNVLNIDMLSV